MAGPLCKRIASRSRLPERSDSNSSLVPSPSGIHSSSHPANQSLIADKDALVLGSDSTHHILPKVSYVPLGPTSTMNSNRKFSYASVKEDLGKDIPQTFNSSLSTSDLEEVEWIAWPCSPWCKSKGICSHHHGGNHDQYVRARLEGYARSNPRKLDRILDELEKRKIAQEQFNLSFVSEVDKIIHHTPSLSIQAWRDHVKTFGHPSFPSEDAGDEGAILDEGEGFIETHTSEGNPLTPLETLPTEILDLVFSYVTVDHTADPYARPHVDLVSCALVSKKVHAAAMRVMYRHVSIPQSKAFSKFTQTLVSASELGCLVRWLDFSHFSSIGFGRARSTAARTPWLTPETLRACLDMTPNLQAFLVHEHIDDELDVSVISKLFRMPTIEVLDFCACSSNSFAEAFTKACTLMPPADNTMVLSSSFSHSIKRLSLHECQTLQAPVFEALLPRLTKLTHLDVAHTMITDSALLSIPNTAEITHLNLERCTRLTGSAVVKFLTRHDAAKNTMVYLNVMSDSTTHRLLSEGDVTKLLPALPTTLRSLNIGGARINASHVPDLHRLATHLEELGLRGADLSLGTEINSIFGLERDDGSEDQTSNKSSLRYIDLAGVKSVTQMSLCYSPKSLTHKTTEPLEVIEVGPNIVEELKKRNAKVKNPEWCVRELGRRGWFVRQPTQGQGVVDDGYRSWKMGARWWGMRKIPMVEQEVGGMYGYFMFKRS